MSEALKALARRAGIEDGYWDFFGNRHETGPDAKRALLAAMRLPAGTDAEAREALASLERDEWQPVLGPISVTDAARAPLVATASLPAHWDDALIRIVAVAADGSEHAAEGLVRDLEWKAEHWLEGVRYHRRALRIFGLSVGEYRLRLDLPDGSHAAQPLIVAPSGAYSAVELERGRGLWGIATQLYALRSGTDWGVGDFTALRELCLAGSGLGAATVGVNPLHALFAAMPQRFGPYAPSSRCALNVAYIDVTAMPEFESCDAARAKVAEQDFQRRLQGLRDGGLIDYGAVGRLKTDVLGDLYRHFKDAPDEGRQAAFSAFADQSSKMVALFDALQEHFTSRDPNLGYWRHWPSEFRNPGSDAVRRFQEEQSERVGFFLWLQFIADEQSKAVQQTCSDAGMPIGLYRDLGVGIADDGAEAWSRQDCTALDVSIGAPPDPLAPNGQDWGLVPFDPRALRASAYDAFRDVLSSNMRHAGALRLDHAMSLQRLYWVPRGLGAKEGAYVRYPVDDLLALVAFESQRQRCMVIGEDLGTVPDGFRERMAQCNVFAYRVLYFEKDAPGSFRAPETYTRQALTTVGTHDLPSLRGWWQGYDLRLRAALEPDQDPSLLSRQQDARAADRANLVAALAERGLLDPGFSIAAEIDDARFEILMRAVHKFLNRAASRLVMAQIEDITGLVLQMNLPGTVDEHPNWRQRYPMDIDALARDPRLRDVALHLLADRDFRVADDRTGG